MVLFLALVLSAAAEPWQVLGAEEGIETAWRPAAGNRLAYQGRAVVPADLYATMAVLIDEGRAPGWAHLCAEARVLAAPSPLAFVTYRRNRAGAPFVADRDMVLDVKVVPDLARGRLTLAFARHTADGAWPPPAGVVRVPAIAGFFRCDEVDARHTQVLYQVEVDVGGSLPAWLLRRATAELPRQTLRGLRRELAATDDGAGASALKARLAAAAPAAAPPQGE